MCKPRFICVMRTLEALSEMIGILLCACIVSNFLKSQHADFLLLTQRQSFTGSL